MNRADDQVQNQANSMQ
jgi:hypothetical protein